MPPRDLTTLLCANPSCRMRLLNPKQVTPDGIPPHVDDILICGGCGLASKVTLLGTDLLTDDDFLTLSPEERRDISFAIRAVKRNLRSS